MHLWLWQAQAIKGFTVRFPCIASVAERHPHRMCVGGSIPSAWVTEEFCMNGFHLILQDCCQYCKDFEPKLIQMNITKVSDKNEKYLNNITCENFDKCERLMERLKNKHV